MSHINLVWKKKKGRGGGEGGGRGQRGNKESGRFLLSQEEGSSERETGLEKS